jgi:hypothetical protein
VSSGGFEKMAADTSCRWEEGYNIFLPHLKAYKFFQTYIKYKYVIRKSTSVVC